MIYVRIFFDVGIIPAITLPCCISFTCFSNQACSVASESTRMRNMAHMPKSPVKLNLGSKADENSYSSPAHPLTSDQILTFNQEMVV